MTKPIALCEHRHLSLCRLSSVAKAHLRLFVCCPIRIAVTVAWHCSPVNLFGTAANVLRKQDSRLEKTGQREPWHSWLKGFQLCTIIWPAQYSLTSRLLTFIVHCMQNLAAWAVAGTAAYILWIKPEQKEQQKRVRQMSYFSIGCTVCLIASLIRQPIAL